MKKLACIFMLIGSTMVWADESQKSELSFPTQATDIVEQLSKPVAPKRERKGLRDNKGAGGVVQDNPKVGALILFDFDSADIKPESYPLLREFATAFNGGLSGVKIAIAGHTDSMGDEDYNSDLSKRRAQSVKNFLTSAYSVEENNLIIQSFGESTPIQTNETEEGRSQNRRVEFIRVE